MKVSIIMPSYNSFDYIGKSIESVIQQTHRNWELLVIDDSSTDCTEQIVNSYLSGDNRIRFHRLQVNSGAAVARNYGIKQASGRFIAFLDSDDSWYPNKLERQLAFMLNHRVAFSYTAYQKIDGNGKFLTQFGVPSRVSYSSLLKKCEIGCLTAMYDTQILSKIYMPNIRKRQDLGLWLRILREIPYAYGLQEVLASYTVRSDSISANKKNAAIFTWRLYRDVEKLSLLRASYYFSCYTINGILRTKFPKIARKIGVLK